ncbi:anthranilate phosphoribosyltransferase [Bartonella sp. HY329]|uniref:anthranilate phosphoribosyltransferase n=1 Tax=unclassified Bartonella TaxID=2645622 RepID=UPI0021C999DC|nr:MULTISPECIES: anthranilate phosphoribosyltransferase [unclassified Bartonella]UXM93999.1 anthranilate phosphoribosyltransferase [Bartonella sp. HY329]UXN08321.1 anthranilate phosphoribosyltransferase [Bartonella sp. HY328]
MADLKPFINKVATATPLTQDEAEQAFTIMMSGQATPSQIGAFLMALRVRGETIEEITGAVKAMRAKMLPVKAPEDVIDIVGTGGDQSGSYNVSTATAFVVAGAGLPVGKHGNRALSSRSGAADALKALGIDIDINAEQIATCIAEAGIGFMFAPTHHSAMRHVGPARVELGTRTIFNILGPLSNPAGATRQLIGVFSPYWLEPVARTLQASGSKSLWVVHGDGMDELTTSGETEVVAIKDGVFSRFIVTPEEVGLKRVSKDDLKGGDPEYNAAALKRVLEGEKGAYRDIVLLNAAASFIIADKVANLSDGVELARESIDSGRALNKLQLLISVSNRQEAVL